jgi:dTMP kinase
MTTNPYHGKLIVFEGLDGSGQTTQAHLLTKWFSEKRNQLAYYTKEPTEGPVGALLKLALRHRLGANNQKTLGPLDEVTMGLFFAADRADHLHSEIIPKLKDGIHVIADRYYLSSLAYQSVVADYEWIREINKHAIRPDLTIFLNVLPSICVRRMQEQRWHVELYEDQRNLERVRDNYLSSISKLQYQGERIETINVEQPVKDVHKEVVQLVKNFFRQLATPEKQNNLQRRDKHQLELLMNTEPLTEQEIAAQRQG